MSNIKTLKLVYGFTFLNIVHNEKLYVFATIAYHKHRFYIFDIQLAKKFKKFLQFATLI